MCSFFVAFSSFVSLFFHGNIRGTIFLSEVHQIARNTRIWGNQKMVLSISLYSKMGLKSSSPNWLEMILYATNILGYIYMGG